MVATEPRPIRAKGEPEYPPRVMTVTPALATEWLARQGANRKVSPRVVDRYADAIRRGEWRLTGEAIKFDTNGDLADGQHRLQAVVLAGLPIETYVVYGIEPAAFDVMDTGRVRTGVDILYLHGYTSSTMLLHAAARFLIIIERWQEERYGPIPYLNTRWGSYGQTTTAQVLAYVLAHPELEDGLHTAQHVFQKNIPGGRGLWGGLLCWFGRFDADDADDFAEKVASGADLAASDPILMLRHALFEARTTHARLNELWAAAIIIKAWNAYRTKKNIGVLRFSLKGERFPEPV